MPVPRKLRDPKPGEPLGYGQGSLSWDTERPGVMVLRYLHDGKRYAERGRSWAEVDGKRQARLARLAEMADPYRHAVRQAAQAKLDAMDLFDLEDFLGIGEMTSKDRATFLGLDRP